MDAELLVKTAKEWAEQDDKQKADFLEQVVSGVLRMDAKLSQLEEAVRVLNRQQDVRRTV